MEIIMLKECPGAIGSEIAPECGKWISINSELCDECEEENA
jgi:hypothetical protein